MVTKLNFHVSLRPSYLRYLHILTIVDLVWTADKEYGLCLIYMQRTVLLPCLNMQACYLGRTLMNTAMTKSAKRNVTRLFPAMIVLVTAPFLCVSLAGEWNKLTKFSLTNGPSRPQTCGNLPSLCWTQMFRHCFIVGCLVYDRQELTPQRIVLCTLVDKHVPMHGISGCTRGICSLPLLFHTVQICSFNLHCSFLELTE